MPRAVRQSIRNSSAETHENGNFLTIGTKKIGMDNNNPYKQLPFTLFGYFLPVCDLSGCSTSNNLPNNSCEISVKNGSAPSHERFSSNFSLKPFSMYAEQVLIGECIFSSESSLEFHDQVNFFTGKKD